MPKPVTYGLYIDGHWRDANDGATFERRAPADGALLGSFAIAASDDVDAAVGAARRAFDVGPWPHASPAERAIVLRRLAQFMRRDREELALVESAQSGATREQARNFVAFNADIFEFYAGLVRDLSGRAFWFGDSGPIDLGLTLREPIGVAALIPPWNFPLGHLTWKLAPALAVGCTVVVKPASWTPITALRLADLLDEAGLPAGVYNVLTGPGETVGDALVGHPGVDKVSLTGETATGRRIMTRAAPTIKRVTLELGGKCPNVVFADADLDEAVAGAISGAFYRAGQVCNAGSRLLVEASIHDAFVEQMVEAATTLRVGHPDENDVFYGPMIAEPQAERVETYLRAGHQEGAKVALAGGRLHGGVFDAGPYLGPTIFDHVRPSSRIFREEIFGPVVSVTSFTDEAEAVRLANDTRYGLAAGIWTADLDRARRVMRALRVGTVWVNTFNQLSLELPFGGYSESGVGRELGREALEAYTELKSISFGRKGFAWQGAPVKPGVGSPEDPSAQRGF
jgi:acyl-CoA reductase-like NAD-dependent aldehyde dehydrogenase